MRKVWMDEQAFETTDKLLGFIGHYTSEKYLIEITFDRDDGGWKGTATVFELQPANAD